jgi:hypothetical protein
MIRHRINLEERLVTIRFTGDVPWAETQRVFLGMKEECPELVTFDAINDLREQTSALPSAQVIEMSRFSKHLGLHEHERRSVALVCSKVHFGVSRMFEQMTEHESKVQRLTTESVEAAAQWLGRSESLVRAELTATEGVQ